MEKKYRCNKCGKTVKKHDNEIPKCCNKKMIQIPVDICLQPAHAENSRPIVSEEACDNGRAG